MLYAGQSPIPVPMKVGTSQSAGGTLSLSVGSRGGTAGATLSMHAGAADDNRGSAKLDAISLLDMNKSAGQPQVRAEIFKSTEFAEEVSKQAGVRSFRQFCRHVATNQPVGRLQPYTIGNYLVYGRRMQRPQHAPYQLDLLCLVVFSKQEGRLVESFQKFSDVHLLDYIISSFLYHSDRRLLAAKLKNIKLVVDMLRTIYHIDRMVNMPTSDVAVQEMRIAQYMQDVAKQTEEQANYNQNKQKQQQRSKQSPPNQFSRKDRVKQGPHQNVERRPPIPSMRRPETHGFPSMVGQDYESPMSWHYDPGLAANQYLDPSLLLMPQVDAVPTRPMGIPATLGPTPHSIHPHPHSHPHSHLFYGEPSPGVGFSPLMPPYAPPRRAINPNASDEVDIWTPPIPGAETPELRGMARMVRNGSRSRSRSPANSHTLTDLNLALFSQGNINFDTKQLSRDAPEFMPSMALSGATGTAGAAPTVGNMASQTPVLSAQQSKKQVPKPVEQTATQGQSAGQQVATLAGVSNGAASQTPGGDVGATPDQTHARGIQTRPTEHVSNDRMFVQQLGNVNERVGDLRVVVGDVLNARLDRARMKRDQQKMDPVKEQEYNRLCRRGEDMKVGALHAVKDLMDVVETTCLPFFNKGTAESAVAMPRQHHMSKEMETAIESYTHFEQVVQDLKKEEHLDVDMAWGVLEAMYRAFSMKNALQDNHTSLFLSVVALIKDTTKDREPDLHISASNKRDTHTIAPPTRDENATTDDESPEPEEEAKAEFENPYEEPMGEPSAGETSDEDESRDPDGAKCSDQGKANGSHLVCDQTEGSLSHMSDASDDVVLPMPMMSSSSGRRTRGHQRTQSMPAQVLSQRINKPRVRFPDRLVEKTMAALSNEEVSDILGNALSFDFDVEVLDTNRHVRGDCMVVAAMFLMERHGFCKPGVVCERGLEKTELIKFFYVIQQSYNRDVIYHNHQHACDIILTVNWLLENATALKRNVTPFTHFVMLVAAAGHDVGHTGHNNDFHRAMNSELVRNNQQSPLENHHMQFTLETLRQKGCNWFVRLDPKQQGEARNIISRTIMMTDMAFHDKQLVQMASLAAAVKEAGDRALSRELQLQLLEATLHFADVANGVKKIAVSKKWAKRIVHEFREQGHEEEKEWGKVRQPALMFQEEHPLEKTQQGWLGMLRHFVEAWVAINEDHAWMLRRANENLKFWQEYKEKQ